MIARVWRGWARGDLADDYQRHYQTHVAYVLREVAGFRGARLLRRDDLDEVMFTSITGFTDWTRWSASPAPTTGAPWSRMAPGGC